MPNSLLTASPPPDESVSQSEINLSVALHAAAHCDLASSTDMASTGPGAAANARAAMPNDAEEVRKNLLAMGGRWDRAVAAMVRSSIILRVAWEDGGW